MYGGQCHGDGKEDSMLGVGVAEMNGAWMKSQYYLTAGKLQVRGTDQYVWKDRYDF